MITRFYRFEKEWNEPFDTSLDSETTFLLMFGEMGRDERLNRAIEEVCLAFPKALKGGCSGAGEIFGEQLFENTLVVAVVRLEKSRVRKVDIPIASAEESKAVGRKVVESLLDDSLKSIFVLSEGLTINGSELSVGINEVLPKGVNVTGGLAGDDDRFEKTYLLGQDCRVASEVVTAFGFYGECFRSATGYRGGWDRFGVERMITSSKKNILYTLNEEPALDVYRRYLGKYAQGLPASGLLFPLAVRASKESDETKVRTILAIDEKERSITFAGDIPEGGYATFMKANFDRLIDGAYEAASMMTEGVHIDGSALSIAISCVGRKLVLKERTEEELEAICDVLPEGTGQIGFYSYGEISLMSTGTCDLFNQTMTLTLMWEE
ncbi:FIST signal transduction protein [Hydrogenimonas cancrithermarum]|uniref:Uncharacterized protein n=1 Tax=Hydrogenimonas cancrithermarum TaxID=2993563 RepID=A0ABN6WYP2_9BACT|nr:FIST N-terminal domain-containing protein [Hydrogenimonas cancrithermarum]BDY13365.1 hypothetical protein HCR_16770 [Hydrogenimonas cancrithermarum]